MICGVTLVFVWVVGFWAWKVVNKGVAFLEVIHSLSCTQVLLLLSAFIADCVIAVYFPFHLWESRHFSRGT